MVEDQRPELDWQGAVPVARQFDDPYFSLQDGRAETEHVFLAGNGLPERFASGFQIAELGFGTGLNAAVALSAWRRSGQREPLRYTAFEMYPMEAADRQRALSHWPALADECKAIERALRGEAADIALTIVVGDARMTLSGWKGAADAWFLDGFAPAKNPELWEPELLADVARHTRPGGSVATYTAAGHVRRALAGAGFDVERTPGFGSKRHMTRGRLP